MSVTNTVFALAIGDSLGLKAEYRSAGEVASLYPDGLPQHFEEVRRSIFGYQEVFPAGSWSDDTDQSLCILRAAMEANTIEGLVSGFAHHLKSWSVKNPTSMGRHTRRVLTHPSFLTDPVRISQEVWDVNPPRIPPNGGVMRTAVVGLLNPEDLAWTEDVAIRLCRVTHVGLECVTSCVLVSVAVACLVRDESYEETMRVVEALAHKHDPNAISWLSMGLSELGLDEGLPLRKGVQTSAGHTYKTMGAAFWALRQTQDPSFDMFRTFESIIMAGGDTDTNCCVAGALMGASGKTLPPLHLNFHSDMALKFHIFSLSERGSFVNPISRYFV